MKNTLPTSLKVLALSTAISITTACSTAANKTDSADLVRQKLSALQADPQLASRAQVAIKEAEIATRIAEESEGNEKLAEHQVYMADHKVEIAMAIAQSRLLEDQREDLTEQREEA